MIESIFAEVNQMLKKCLLFLYLSVWHNNRHWERGRDRAPMGGSSYRRLDSIANVAKSYDRSLHFSFNVSIEIYEGFLDTLRFT